MCKVTLRRKWRRRWLRLCHLMLIILLELKLILWILSLELLLNRCRGGKPSLPRHKLPTKRKDHPPHLLTLNHWTLAKTLKTQLSSNPKKIKGSDSNLDYAPKPKKPTVRIKPLQWYFNYKLSIAASRASLSSATIFSCSIASWSSTSPLVKATENISFWKLIGFFHPT